MRRNRRTAGPPPAYSPTTTLLVTAGLVGTMLTLLFAAAQPLIVLAVVALGAAGRLLGRSLRARRREHRTRTWGVPLMDRCIEV